MSIADPAPKERLARPVNLWLALRGEGGCPASGVGGGVLAAGAHINR